MLPAANMADRWRGGGDKNKWKDSGRQDEEKAWKPTGWRGNKDSSWTTKWQRQRSGTPEDDWWRDQSDKSTTEKDGGKWRGAHTSYKEDVARDDRDKDQRKYQVEPKKCVLTAASSRKQGEEQAPNRSSSSSGVQTRSWREEEDKEARKSRKTQETGKDLWKWAYEESYKRQCSIGRKTPCKFEFSNKGCRLKGACSFSHDPDFAKAHKARTEEFGKIASRNVKTENTAE